MGKVANNGYISDYARRFMVVVGVNSYEEGSGLPSLRTPVADACRIFGLLKDQFGFEGRLLAEREEVRRYEAEHGGDVNLESYIEGDGTRVDIEQAIWHLTQMAHPDDLFLFYYGGHGTQEGGTGFLLPYGTVLRRYDTYLMYPELFGTIDALPCLHKLLFFDCCFSGVVTRDIFVALEGTPPSGDGTCGQAPIPQILLDSAMASFASTDAFNAAPDQYHVWHDKDDNGRLSAYSPFGDALATLLEQVPCGTSLIPAAIHNGLFQGVRARVDTVATMDGGRVTLQPTARLVGAATIFLKKRGSQPLDTAMAVEYGKSEISRYTGEKMRLETQYLPVCHIQKDYRASIEVTGGTAPMRVEAEGLPSGMDISASGELYGRVDANVAVGGGCLHVFAVCVTDCTGEQLRERLAIPIIDPDVYAAVPAGDFQFGYSPTAERTQTLNQMGIMPSVMERLIRDHPAGTTMLPLFFIRRHPLTNRDWKAFVEQRNYPGLPTRWECADDPEFWRREGNVPVTGLTGRDVEAFCEWRQTHLPTRFQWEKAARGTDGRLFPWGDDFQPYYCTCIEQHRGMYSCELVKSNPSLFVTRVDQHPQGKSPCGAEDLVGNTWELTGQVLWDEANVPYFARMGGSAAEGGVNLATCFGCTLKHAVRGTFDGSGNRVHMSPGRLPSLTGFRDVIELAQGPPFRQGFVKLARPSTALRLNGVPDVFAGYDAYIARYQVSNAEYAEFVRDTGHSLPRHWSNRDKWFFPFHLRFHPVVYVEWQDALEFCRWKSERLGVRCEPMNATLWRLAVHQPQRGDGDCPRKYPWGNEYSEGLCNHPASGYGGTIPVFELPGGRATCGAWNLVGNAAEWVSPTETAGGSWLHGIQSPERFIVTDATAGPAVGFRYFTWDPMVAEKNKSHATTDVIS